MKLVTKLPKNPLIKYSSYSDVMILHYDIPPDTAKAVFLFKVEDSPTSILGTYKRLTKRGHEDLNSRNTFR